MQVCADVVRGGWAGGPVSVLCEWDMCRTRKLPLCQGVYCLHLFNLCRDSCFPNLTMEKVDELRAKWGNIPRYVLEKVN